MLNEMLAENTAVAQISKMFALPLGYPLYRSHQIHNAALLHDIGKAHIPRCILGKPGKLTPYEFEIMKLHTKFGAWMLSGVGGDFGNLARQVSQYHHEWVNGGGYWGIPVGQLPGYVPIVSIADVFVSCCAARSYKPPWTIEQTLEYIKGQASTQFCPKLAEAFIHMVKASDEAKEISAIIAPLQLNNRFETRKEMISCEQKI